MAERNTIMNHPSQTDQQYIGISRGLFEDSAMKGLQGDDDHINTSQHNQTTEFEVGKMGSTENMHMFIESDINATQQQEFNYKIEGQQKHNLSQRVRNNYKKIVLLCKNNNQAVMEKKNNLNNDALNTSICIQKNYSNTLNIQNTYDDSQQGKQIKFMTMKSTQIPNIPLKQLNGQNNSNKYQSDFDLTCQKIDSIKDVSSKHSEQCNQQINEQSSKNRQTCKVFCINSKVKNEESTTAKFIGSLNIAIE
ncbi:cyclic nucleotide-binding domain protein (macronuclear) [Tetrahymena thermophila SB210]|uniref:Cyclic nucleotide-binding domain protein n=1 Tax=Tetrahymena thermophila (strain SB210) TaxID=312017 RepID=W7XL76_TETTS|nr:cyclic nucleotide-binding domain protein [Tetrahymena thermophila SB210]EWS75804.1 cyclic nucleotide-binding domain protein [Tetrahymena thermophila SB210]|eukprot:XP_012651726.1 cyclic nucleotide-binding domain protein [Tetrahymena thermophila SB210]